MSRFINPFYPTFIVTLKYESGETHHPSYYTTSHLYYLQHKAHNAAVEVRVTDRVVNRILKYKIVFIFVQAYVYNINDHNWLVLTVTFQNVYALNLTFFYTI